MRVFYSNEEGDSIVQNSNCFCMSGIGRDCKDAIELTCGCLIHYDCLLQYIRMALGDKISLLNSIPNDWNKADAGILCPYFFSKDCKSDQKTFITISELEFLSSACVDILSSVEAAMDEDRIEEKEIEKLKSWLQEEESTDEVSSASLTTDVDFTTDAFIAATTKPCPSCKMPGTHYHGHACHHISPSGGCTNCKTHYCYRCLSTESENIAQRQNRSSCLCGFWSTFCLPVITAKEIRQHIKLTPYPHDKRCGCPICPDCSPDKPCETCPGDCIVCIGILVPGPRELDSKVIGSFTWGRLVDSLPIYKRFMDACRYVNFEEIKNILKEAKEKNFNLNVKDNLGRDALHYLSDGPFSTIRMECFNIVVDEFPSQITSEDYSENTPLHLAAHHGNEELIKKIFNVLSSLEESSDEYVNIKNSQSKSAFDEAASGDHRQCCQILLENGAKVNMKEILPAAVKYGYVEIVEMLLHRCISKFKDFRELLSICLLESIIFKKYEITEIFLKMKAGDINFIDNYENSAFHYAVSSGNIEVLKLLLHADSSNIKEIINKRNYQGETALIKACRLGYVDIVDLLLQLDPDVHIKDNSKQTAETLSKTKVIKDKIKEYCIKNSIPKPLVIQKKKITKEEKPSVNITVQQQPISQIEVFRTVKNDNSSDYNNSIHEESFICGSEASSTHQCEELEVLESIFDDKIKIIRPPPKQIGEPTCKFEITCQFKSIFLIFTMTNDYPNTLPIVEISKGNLSLFEFSSEMHRQVESIIQTILSRKILTGEVCTFDIIQAVNDFLAS